MKENSPKKAFFSFFPHTIHTLYLVLTSLLLILSYPKFNFGFLAWFAFVPFISCLWKIKNGKKAAFYGFLTGLFFYSGIFCWIYFTLRAPGLSVFVSLFSYLLLALVMSVEFAIISLIAFYFKKVGRKVFPYVFAFSWASLEGFKLFVSQKIIWFPWFLLGYTQWRYESIIQIVSLFGVSFLSFAIALNGALIGTMRPRERNFSSEILRLIPSALLFLFIFAYGKISLKNKVSSGEKIRVVLLQPSIDFYKKWDEKYRIWIEDRLRALLGRVKRADLIIWPENALPGQIDEKKYVLWFGDIYAALKAESIVGAVSQFDEKHVSAFLIGEKGKMISAYHKRKLVPFGEFVPLRSLLGKFIKPIGELGEFEPGALKQDLFSVKGAKIGVLICYESIFPYLAQGDAEKGADVFVNITNDGWYLDTAAPYQHFIVNIFRAVENRKPLLRAANNGISAYISPWGEILNKLDLNEYGLIRTEVDVYKEKHKNYSKIFYLMCLIISMAFVIAVVLV